MRRYISLGGTLIVCLWVQSAFAAQSNRGEISTYTIAAITTPNALPQAINEQGDVTGYVNNAGAYVSYVWSAGTATPLPTPAGHAGAIATAINDEGVVVGHTYPFPSIAVQWTDGNVELLGTLGGGWSAANGINNAGVVTGWAQVEESSSRFHGFMYQTNVMKSAGLQFGGTSSELLDVNDAGVAVGNGINITSNFRAMLVDPNQGVLDLGTLGGITSAATAISDAGHVTGQAQTGVANPSTSQGIERHAFLWHKGKMIDLGTLPGSVESAGRDVNSSGHVIGVATNPDSSNRPFLWKEGTLIDLNSAIPGGSGWVLLSVTSINDAGQIAGAGLLNGQPRGFVLAPSTARRASAAAKKAGDSDE